MTNTAEAAVPKARPSGHTAAKATAHTIPHAWSTAKAMAKSAMIAHGWAAPTAM